MGHTASMAHNEFSPYVDDMHITKSYIMSSDYLVECLSNRTICTEE